MKLIESRKINNGVTSIKCPKCGGNLTEIGKKFGNPHRETFTLTQKEKDCGWCGGEDFSEFVSTCLGMEYQCDKCLMKFIDTDDTSFM